MMAAAIAITVTGCSMLTKTPNPAYTSTSPTGVVTTNANVPPTLVTVSPGFSNASNTIQSYVPMAETLVAATPASPLAPLIPGAVTTVLGIIGTVLGYMANSQNKKAAASLAATVNQAGLTGVAMTNAAQNNSTATVATHIANAQSLT